MTSGNDNFWQEDTMPGLPREARAVDHWLSADGTRWQARVPSHEALDDRAWTLSGMPSRPAGQSQPTGRSDAGTSASRWPLDLEASPRLRDAGRC